MEDLLYELLYFLMLPVFLFTLWAQINVKSTFTKNQKVYAGMTGYEAARKILDANRLYDVGIERVSGELTDHYDPRTNTIRLSDGVYSNSSAASVGVAAHEAGHAVQYAVGYSPIKFRSAIIPVCQFGSRSAMPLFLIGMLLANFSGYIGWYLMIGGILLYSAVTFFQLVTLPVEFNASRRALKALEGYGLSGEQLDSSKKVLRAAAMTYVAALASSLISLLRLILIASSGRGGRRR